MRSVVYDRNGIELDFEQVVYWMEEELRELAQRLFLPCPDQQFFDKYCILHKWFYKSRFIWDGDDFPLLPDEEFDEDVPAQ